VKRKVVLKTKRRLLPKEWPLVVMMTRFPSVRLGKLWVHHLASLAHTRHRCRLSASAAATPCIQAKMHRAQVLQQDPNFFINFNLSA
jgi:hypothetical protein